MKKDAVFFSNGIGNFILATPLIRQLDNPEIVIPADDARAAAVESLSLWPVRRVSRSEIAACAGQYGRCLVLWCFPQEWAPQGPNVILQPSPDWSKSAHETETYLSLLPGAKPEKTAIKTRRSWDLHLGSHQRLVAICDGANSRARWRNKRLPARVVARLARELLEAYPDLQFVYLGDESEKIIGDSVKMLIGNRCWNFAGLLSFAESCGLLAQSDMVITNDTGLMHAADALDRPIVAIWFWTSWAKNHPWNAKEIRAVKSPGGGCPHFPCFGKPEMWSCNNPVCTSIPFTWIFEAARELVVEAFAEKHESPKPRKIQPKEIQKAVEDYGVNHWLKNHVYRNLHTKPWHASRIKTVCENIRGNSILDVACATGELTAEIKKAANPARIVAYEGCGAVLEQGRAWHPDIEWVQGLVEDLPKPFPKKSFDSIHAGEILEHVTDPKGFIKRLSGLTRNQLVLTTPKDVVVDPGHVAIFTEAALKELLEVRFRQVRILESERSFVAVAERPR